MLSEKKFGGRKIRKITVLVSKAKFMSKSGNTVINTLYLYCYHNTKRINSFITTTKKSSVKKGNNNIIFQIILKMMI